MVRCHLDASRENSELRYIPASEFDLWQHLMESKHGRPVSVDEVSVWVPETPEVWDDAIDSDRLDAVVRVRFEKPGPQGTAVPVVRYFPTETYREAKSALLAHFDLRCRWSVEVTPGYFVAAASNGAREESLEEDARSDQAELELVS